MARGDQIVYFMLTERFTFSQVLNASETLAERLHDPKARRIIYLNGGYRR